MSTKPLTWTYGVEMMGLEPTTPCLQSRCSSQLSYIPDAEGCRPAGHRTTSGCSIVGRHGWRAARLGHRWPQDQEERPPPWPARWCFFNYPAGGPGEGAGRTG